MKLLVVSQYFWPETFRINDLVTELSARGHEITVLTGLPNYPDGQVFADFSASPSSFGAYQGARIVRVPLIPRGTGSARLAINYLSFAVSSLTLGAWKLRDESFDAVFCFQLSPVTSALPALLQGRLKHAPVTMWVLDLWPETLSALGVLQAGKLLSLVGRLVRFIYKRTDRVLAQSPGFFPSFEAHGVTRERAHFFPGWAEQIDVPEGPITPAPEVDCSDGRFRVIFTGNVGEAQDFPTVVKAAELLKQQRANAKIVVVGDGRAAKWVRDEINRLGLDDHLQMVGRYPLERMPSFFAAADALLVTLAPDPTLDRTIPGKVQTYLAAGRPIVAMLGGDGADVVRASGAGMVSAPGDSEALAANVVALSGMTEMQRSAMADAGLAYSETYFNRDALVSQLESWLATPIFHASAPRQTSSA